MRRYAALCEKPLSDRRCQDSKPDRGKLDCGSVNFIVKIEQRGERGVRSSQSGRDFGGGLLLPLFTAVSCLVLVARGAVSVCACNSHVSPFSTPLERRIRHVRRTGDTSFFEIGRREMHSCRVQTDRGWLKVKHIRRLYGCVISVRTAEGGRGGGRKLLRRGEAREAQSGRASPGVEPEPARPPARCLRQKTSVSRKDF